LIRLPQLVVASPSPWLGFDKKRRATAHREMTQSHALSASAHPPMADGTDASIEARVTNQYQSPYTVLP
jgi:hypothetical protein